METESLLEVKGRVVKEPELRFLADGTECGTMLLPLSTARQGVDSKPYWLQITAFSSLAKKVIENIYLGDMVVVKGRLSASRWIGQDGIEKANLGVVAYAVGKVTSLSEPVLFMLADKKPNAEKPTAGEPKVLPGVATPIRPVYTQAEREEYALKQLQAIHAKEAEAKLEREKAQAVKEAEITAGRKRAEKMGQQAIEPDDIPF